MGYEQILSQDEVDALMSGVTGEETATPSAASAGGGADALPRYDLGREQRIVRGRMQTLEVINERFARNLRTGFFNFMRRTADITVGSVSVQKYSDYVRHLPLPANINLIHMKPLRGTAMLVLDPNLVFMVVDNLFGGDGRYHTRVEGRDFTATEHRIVQRLLKIVLEGYGKAWHPVYPLEFEYIRSEMNTKSTNVATANEVIVNTTFHIEFGPIGGAMHICMPYSMIEPIRGLLMNPIQDEVEIDRRWVRQLATQVQSADLQLRAEFATINSTIGQLMKLKAGDVLPIDLPDTIVAKVDNVPVMECGFGILNERYALRVKQLINRQDIEATATRGTDHE